MNRRQGREEAKGNDVRREKRGQRCERNRGKRIEVLLRKGEDISTSGDPLGGIVNPLAIKGVCTYDCLSIRSIDKLLGARFYQEILL